MEVFLGVYVVGKHRVEVVEKSRQTNPHDAYAMPDLDCIKETLQKTGWNKARVDLLACFLAALLTARSVCLTRLATVLPSTAKSASIYRRLQRFLSGFAFDEATLVRLLVGIANVPRPWVLSLDRTEWKLGKTSVNILMLSVVVGKSAFPLLWLLLEIGGKGKPGASHTDERIALMERFVALFGAESVAYLCADREFIGKEWVGWLLGQGISFRLRVRADTLIEADDGDMACADWLFALSAVGVEKALSGRRLVLGQRLFVRGRRLIKDGKADFLIVVSDSVNRRLELVNPHFW